MFSLPRLPVSPSTRLMSAGWGDSLSRSGGESGACFTACPSRRRATEKSSLFFGAFHISCYARRARQCPSSDGVDRGAMSAACRRHSPGVLGAVVDVDGEAVAVVDEAGGHLGRVELAHLQGRQERAAPEKETTHQFICRRRFHLLRRNRMNGIHRRKHRLQLVNNSSGEQWHSRAAVTSRRRTSHRLAAAREESGYRY